jgi:hypothetical protein
MPNNNKEFLIKNKHGEPLLLSIGQKIVSLTFPDSMKDIAEDMTCVKQVVLSYGPWKERNIKNPWK